jgi:hypothetical protein
LELFSTSLRDAREVLAARGLLLPVIDEALVCRARELVDPHGNFGRLLHFDSVEHAARVLEASKEAYDENLERFAQSAAESAEEERERLADGSQEAAEELLSVLDGLSDVLRQMASSLKRAVARFEALRP